MDYETLDKQWQFTYRADKQAIAESLGYEFITEMIHSLYMKYSNLREVAAVVGVTPDNIRQVLHNMGATLNNRGGRRKSKNTSAS